MQNNHPGKNFISLTEQQKFVDLWTSNGQNVVDAYARSRDPVITEITKSVRVCAKRYAEGSTIAPLLVMAKTKSEIAITESLDKYAITEGRIAAELAKLAFTTVGDVLEWDKDGVRVKASSELDPNVMAAIAEVTEVEGKEGKTIRIKMFDKKAALECLGKHKGMFAEKRDSGGNTVNVQFVIDKSDLAAAIEVNEDRIQLQTLPNDSKVQSE